MKTRFSVVDCVRMAAEVNALLAGSWVQNIYTIEDDSKTFLFKVTGRGEKYLLLLESGVRFHPTEFVREKSEMPSGFAMKLRKHVRGRRLEYCRQVGLDRVVDFAFGKGTQHYHVVLEMYAGGNVILTDEHGLILTLLRPYTQEEVEGRVAVGQHYPFDLAMEGPRALMSTQQEIPQENLAEFLLSTCSSSKDVIEDEGEEEFQLPPKSAPARGPSTVKQDKILPPPPQRKKKKPAKKKTDVEQQDWVQVLSSKGSPYQSLGPQLIGYCLSKAGFDLSLPVKSDFVGAVSLAMKEAISVLALLSDESNTLVGYILSSNSCYEDFSPLAFDAALSASVIEFPSFHQAVDEYFAKIELQKSLKQKITTEKANLSKVENVKIQQMERVEQLGRAVLEREEQAFVLQSHVERVDQALDAISKLRQARMSWEEVDEFVKLEKRNGNPLALMIAKVDLEHNLITMALNDGEETGKKILVDVDVRFSAQTNVRMLFENKKKTREKQQATLAKATHAVEEMQHKLEMQMKKKQSQASEGIRAVRKPFWFEKFHWFLTSEGILVLGGRDAHQNELLVKRFLRKGDAYLHADFHGAATCIVRNPFPNQTSASLSIPVESLRQAGVFCICHSKAWKEKTIASAWWVESHQVSQTAPSGEYLSTGSFMIRGKKNFLTPPKLEMGFGYIFMLDNTMKEKEEGEEEPRNREWRCLHEEAMPSVTLKETTAPDAEVEPPLLLAMEKKKAAKPLLKEAATVEKARTEALVAKPQEPSRKAKLKMKRAAVKYADQSESEKALAMLALGHKPTTTTTELVQPLSPKKEEEEAKGLKEDEASWLRLNKVQNPEKIKKKEEEEGDVDHHEEESVMKEEGERVIFKNFTSMPRPGDVLLYALPFCGPVDAMANFKFKVKLSPGSLKKGKAVKAAVELFNKNTLATDREKTIINSVPEPVNIASMLMEVKISAPGIEKQRAEAKITKKLIATTKLLLED